MKDSLIETERIEEQYEPVETLTDVFNKVVTHLLTQNQISSEYGGSCRYRAFRENDVTLKCAVGCLISDNIYDEDLEDQTANAIDVIKAIQDSNPNLIVSDQIAEMMMQLQFIHDHCEERIWFYMAYLIWRDFNLLFKQSFNNGLMPKTENEFPDTHIYQRNMYVLLAHTMERTELRKNENMLIKLQTIKEQYLNILNSDKADKETPFVFFKKKQSTLNDLSTNKVTTAITY